MPRANRNRIGLTGAFGSGKSAALTILKKLGVQVRDADVAVHQLLDHDAAVRRSVKKAFGTIDKKELAGIVFKSRPQRKKLERLLHPAVEKKMNVGVGPGLVVFDVPLLFEAGWKNKFDTVVVVAAPLRLRVQRLKKRGFSLAQIRARQRAQWPLVKKIKQADVVIMNDGSRHKLQSSVKALVASLGGKNGIAA